MTNNPVFRQPRNLLLALTLFFAPHLLSATTFTAVASGDWSSALTWGGNAPGPNITAADQIIIDLGVTVNMDVDVEIDHQLATMTLLGTLQSADKQLTLTAGTILGTGDLILKKISVGANGVILATGNVVVGILETSSTSLLLSASLHLQNELKISSGSFSLASIGSLLLDSGTTIELAGGSFLADTSLIQATSSINLVYSGSTQTAGPETTIGVIANLVVNLANQGDTLKLSDNLIVTDTLDLQQGYFDLNDQNLTLNGALLTAAATASISGSASSSLTIAGTGDVSLVFAQNGALLDTFTVQQTGGSVTLNSELSVEGSLNLVDGNLLLNDNNLTITGGISTQNGTLTGSAGSNLTIAGTGDVSINFDQNGALLDTFTVQQTNGSVTLNSDLSVGGSLNLEDGQLLLNDNNLTITGSISTQNGTLTGSAGSSLTLDGNGDASLVFSSNGAVLNNFVVSQNNGNVLLSSGLAVEGNIDLQQGSLVLSNSNLTVNGTLNTDAGASITGSTTAGLVLNGTGDLTPVFSANGGILDTLVVNQSSGNVVLGSNLTVGSTVDLLQGSLVLNGTHLTINGALNTTAGASITGSGSSDLTLAGSDSVSLVFSLNGALLDTFTVQQTGGSVTLNSDLSVGGSLNLEDGQLLLNDNNLTITGSISTQDGTLTGSAGSSLTLDGNGDASLVFSSNGAVLNNFVVSQNNGNVLLSSGLAVEGNIDLQQGSLVLTNGNLTVNGMLNTDAGASITGSTTAGLVLNGTGDLTPVFSANGGILDTLVVNQSGGNVVLGSNLTVGNTVDLLQGSLVLNGTHLTINGALNTTAGASITGSNTSGLIFDGSTNIDVVFAPNAALLGTFTVSQLNGTVTLNDDLSVANSVTLHQGTLALNGHNLISKGSFTTVAGATISGSATSGLVLDGTGNAPLTFSLNGALLDTLVVSQSNGIAILGSDLTVGGSLELQQGALSLNGKNLTINGTFSNAAGTTITGNANSALILDGTGDISLQFTQNTALLDTLVVSQNNGNVALTSNLKVGAMLDLQEGALLLNSYDLTLNGALNTAAGASITGSATAGLILDGTGNASLVFTPGTALLEDLVVSQTNGNVVLTADLTVGNQVTLQQGSFVLNGFDLTVKGMLSTAAGASITGSGSSGLILDGTGGVNLTFAPNSAALDTLIVSQTGGNVTLTSDLTVESLVNLQQGSLVLDGNDLIVHGMLTSLAGATITGSPTSGLILDGQGNVTLLFSPAGPVLDTLIVSQSNGFVSMTGDLTVGSLVNLQEGTLVLNGNDLTVNGTLLTSAGASLTGSPFSGLILNGTGDVSLIFAPNGATLSAFVVSQMNGNVSLNSNLTVSNNVSLQQGSLLLNGNNLTLKGSLTTAAGASITGSSTSGLILDGNGHVTLDFAANGAVLDTLVISQMNGNVTLNNDLAIDQNLELQQGKLLLGDFDITLSNNAQVTGGSSSSYVVTDGSGVFSAFVEAGGAGTFFPCGSASGYFPANITQGSGASDTHIEMNVGVGVLADGTTGTDLSATESLVNHTWFVGAADASAQLDLDFKFFWNAAAEVNAFDHGACFISHYVNGGWDSHVVAQSTAEANGYFSISRDHISSLSPFRVADATSSSTSEAQLRDFQMFPNPVSGDMPLTLRFDSPVSEKAQIRLLSATGTVLRTENITVVAGTNDFVLPVANLHAGLYWVVVSGTNPQAEVVRRFVKL